MHSIRSFLLPSLWLVFITWLSTRPGLSLPEFNLFQADKLGHAGAYAVLCWLWLRGFSNYMGEQAHRRMSIAILLFSTNYGVLMEWIQGTFLPGRVCDLDDMIANAFGAVVAWAVFRRFYLGNTP